ncbi:MAG: DUF2470 domain-containing protein [Alphaproteobacteria bacterium]
MTEAAERGNDPEPAALARRLLRGAASGALATVARDAGGRPHASLVLVAIDHDATPVLLISDLAEHSRNIADDDRVARLVGVDAEGCDIRFGPRLLRLDFERPIADPGDARDRLAALAGEARAAADRDRARAPPFGIPLQSIGFPGLASMIEMG